MDIFYEYIVKRKMDAKDYLFIAGIILLALLLTFIFTFTIVAQYLFGMWLLLDAAAWWGAVFLIRQRNLEFEYILTNNELDIDKIMARQRRKRLLTINFKEIEVCARTHDVMFKHQLERTEGLTVIDAAGNPEEENVYFVDFSADGARKRVLFQPNEKIIEALKKVNPRAVNV